MLCIYVTIQFYFFYNIMYQTSVIVLVLDACLFWTKIFQESALSVECLPTYDYQYGVK